MTTPGTKPGRLRLPLPPAAPLLAVTVVLLAYWVTPTWATTLLDPKPENSTTHFGAAVAVVGDITGDGIPDLVVGAPKQDGDFDGASGFGPPQNVGKAFLINGATLGVIRQLDDPDFQLVNLLKFGGQFGNSVASLGDINGDGISDILVGVPHHIVPVAGDNLVNAGRVFVFSGKDGAILFALDDPTPQEGSRMGYAVAGLGDVNGDGVNDFLVGIPKKDSAGGLSEVGTAYVFSGKTGNLIRSLDPPSQGGAEANGLFGEAVANAGDVNHDGVSDILIGAPGQSHAFVFSGANGGLLFTLSSPKADLPPSFGFAVAGGQDLNNDGTVDFAVGAPDQNGFKGAAYIFNGTNGSLQRQLRGTSQAFARFGAAVDLSPDISGDGRPDILVGAPDQTVNSLPTAGEAFIFSGANGNLFKTVASASPKGFAGFGSAITTADFNGDGVPETVIGTPLEDANLIDPQGDLITHLQIGQIEIQ